MQSSTREPGCDLTRSVLALMLHSSVRLSYSLCTRTSGTVKNISKGGPSAIAGRNVAFLLSVSSVQLSNMATDLILNDTSRKIPTAPYVPDQISQGARKNCWSH